ncbi:MAG: hypothetical protein WC755_00330 [Candidatus Woesearchaeota archaeon]|jgi:type III secretion system FlhB-like substrate exporter
MENTGLQVYLDKAVEIAKKYNIVPTSESSRLVDLINELMPTQETPVEDRLDETKLVAIAEVVRYSDSYNQFVRDNIQQMKVKRVFDDINSKFNSIIEDDEERKEMAKDGLSFGEKIHIAKDDLMHGGNYHKRFETIRKDYNDVSDRTKKQIDIEDDVQEGFANFNNASKSAEITAADLFEQQTKIRDRIKSELETTANAVTAYAGTSASEKGTLELTRTLAAQKYKKAESAYALTKDIYELLRTTNSLSEGLMAKVQQWTDLKKAVYTRGVTFFALGNTIFTSVDLLHTQRGGLEEQTKTIESTTQGLNNAIKYLADGAKEVEENAIKAAHGTTISVDATQKFIDAVVQYQIESTGLIQKYQDAATLATNQIHDICEKGKQKVISAITTYDSKKQEQVALPNPQ